MIEYLFAATVPGLFLGFVHYIPWGAILGRQLHRPEAYAIGVFGVAVIPGVMLAWMGYWEPAIIVALSLASGGIVTLLCYALDSYLDNRRRAAVSSRHAANVEAEARSLLDG